MLRVRERRVAILPIRASFAWIASRGKPQVVSSRNQEKPPPCLSRTQKGRTKGLCDAHDLIGFLPFLTLVSVGIGLATRKLPFNVFGCPLLWGRSHLVE